MKLADKVLSIYEKIDGSVGELTTAEHGHKHEIKLDKNGNGKTITTLTPSGELIDKKNKDDQYAVKEHTHIISEGKIQPHEKEIIDHEGKTKKEKHTHKISPKG